MLCKRFRSIVFIEQTLLYFRVARLRLKRGIKEAAVNFACLNEAALKVAYLRTKLSPREVVSGYFHFHGSDETARNEASLVFCASDKPAYVIDLSL
jgi:hypothetical protein